MIVFISGSYERDGSHAARFAEAAAKLEARGHTALNPAVMLPRALDRAPAMMACLGQICAADAVYFLPGWKVSGGAALERRFAAYIGKPVLRDLDTMEAFKDNE